MIYPHSEPASHRVELTDPISFAYDLVSDKQSCDSGPVSLAQVAKDLASERGLARRSARRFRFSGEAA